MKMSELRAENEALKQQVLELSQQKEGDQDAAVTQLKEKNRSLRKSTKDLKTENALLNEKILALEADRAAIDQDHQALQADFERIQQQHSRLSAAHATTTTEVELLRTNVQALQAKASQLPALQAELDRLQQVDAICTEKTAQVVALQAELGQHRQLLEEARAKALKEAADHQDQVAKLTGQMEQVRSQLQAEMELVRNQLQSELDAHQQQSGAQIALLQEQKNDLSAKIADLTDKLKLVATHLERQLSEKKKIASQFDTTAKEHQAYKDKSEKQIADLMSLLQKMAAELDASRAAHPTQESLPAVKVGDKPAIRANLPTTSKPALQQVQELHAQLTELDQINASQARELAALSARMKRINRSLSSPLGRLLSSLMGLKE